MPVLRVDRVPVNKTKFAQELEPGEVAAVFVTSSDAPTYIIYIRLPGPQSPDDELMRVLSLEGSTAFSIINIRKNALVTPVVAHLSIGE